MTHCLAPTLFLAMRLVRPFKSQLPHSARVTFPDGLASKRALAISHKPRSSRSRPVHCGSSFLRADWSANDYQECSHRESGGSRLRSRAVAFLPDKIE